MAQNISLLGIPIDSGKPRGGCLMGPDALRTAGIGAALAALGHNVEDLGNLALPVIEDAPQAGKMYKHTENIAWATAIREAIASIPTATVPILIGGDHAMSLGTLPALSERAADRNKPLFVLWLDAHSDFNTPETSETGNLHGTPLAYATGRPGFDGFPPVPTPVPEAHICLLGLRSVDPGERNVLQESAVAYIDMRRIDERGISAPLQDFLGFVAREGGDLHVSLDVDFLDPAIAPGVGTSVPGGATLREAHLVMEILHECGLVSSLELAELNPFLDERGRTAQIMVDLVASAFGRKVFDRPTRTFG